MNLYYNLCEVIRMTYFLIGIIVGIIGWEIAKWGWVKVFK